MNKSVKAEPEKGVARLTTGPVVTEVPVDVFSTHQGQIEDITFPILPAETLFHLQASQRRWRIQDVSSIHAIGTYIYHHPNPEYPEENYVSFHQHLRALKAVRNNWRFKLIDIGHMYMDSPMNKVLPLDSPRIRRPLETTWGFISTVGSGRRGRRT